MKKIFSTVRAFTLIELLVVIAIIAILTGIILTDLTSSKAKARDAQRVSDIGQIQLALELYFDRCQQYPATLTLTASNGCPVVSGVPVVTLSSYTSSIPTPPAGTGKTSYDYAVNSSSPTDYVLHTSLENSNSAQQNSLNQSNLPAWAQSGLSFSCYSGSAASLDYCVGPK